MNPIIKTFKLVIILLLFFVSGIHAQKCPINSLPYEPFVFSNNGLISSLYEQVKTDDSISFNLLYVVFLHQVNKKSAYWLSIDKQRNFTIKAVTADSVIFSGCIQTTEKYNVDAVLSTEPTDKYLVSECNYVVSSHRRSMFLLYNHKVHKWVEYLSMDGYMKEALIENKQYYYLQKCYNLLEAVFQDVNIVITK